MSSLQRPSVSLGKETALLLILLFSALFRLSSSSDTMNATESIKDKDVLVSDSGTFVLGFFRPGNSVQRFLGIWYDRVSVQPVVWVANRENPLNDNSGTLSIDSQGNLIISSENGASPVWSTNIPSLPSPSGPVVQLLDSGNLVLYEDVNKNVIRWQSFNHPTDTQLPNTKLGFKRTGNLTWSLTSWRSYDDPRPGNCMYKVNPTGYPQLVFYKYGKPSWRAGSWTGRRWSGIPRMLNLEIFNYTFVNDGDEFSITYTMFNASVKSRLVVNETGNIQRMNWIDRQQQWTPLFFYPTEPCDYYNQCGPNGICDSYNADHYMCSCLPGFEPRYPYDWLLKDTTGGCIRNSGASICRSGDGFVNINNTKVPDTSIARVSMTMTLIECESACLRDCSCTAYASANESGGGSGCLMWYGELNDTRTFNIGQQIYVRVDAAELARHTKTNSWNRNKKTRPWTKLLLLATAISVGLVSIVLLMRKKRGSKKPPALWPRSPNSPSSITESLQMMELHGTSKSEAELPYFNLSSIVAATDNFSLSNRLGIGGFGAVYKGVMSDGTEVAVKRLSEFSKQGYEEFKNEVNLIARLQHRNLVKMIGFCLEDKEKILVYEYLPNKSLNAFLFDESKKSLLDWRLRFNILIGVARGLMYLHQDSRLRVIHRDLKAGNILLDAAMIPKISDFGMAKICWGDQFEGITKRVVGTYGYMSPEYAMEGLFSVKSDVYSFGILLLEIISGKRISSYYDESSYTNLVGHVWELWKEGRCMEIVDESISMVIDDDPHSSEEVLKCIHVGLLCVQELATDRPTMSTVVCMLGNDTVLPSPKKPAYTIKKNLIWSDDSTREGAISVNDASITSMGGR